MATIIGATIIGATFYGGTIVGETRVPRSACYEDSAAIVVPYSKTRVCVPVDNIQQLIERLNAK